MNKRSNVIQFIFMEGTMNFINQLNKIIDKHHMLKHPFYQAWQEGKLSQETLKEYALEYIPFIQAFPQFVSATHSFCDNMEGRQMLLENLNEEEQGTENHPKLWRDFAESLGASKEDIETRMADVSAQNANKKTQRLIRNFFKAARTNYACGLASLYAYEQQIPPVSTTKIKGLKEYYNIKDEKALKFFTVHEEADVVHSEQCRQLLEQISPKQRSKALKAAQQTSKSLWDFLSEIWEQCPESKYN